MQPVYVRLIVHQVPHAFELRMPLQVVEGRSQVGISQIHPADHAANEFVLLSQFEQPAGFLDHHVRLHHYRAIESVPVENRFQIVRQKIAAQRRLALGHPRIPEAADIPEMLV